MKKLSFTIILTTIIIILIILICGLFLYKKDQYEHYISIVPNNSKNDTSYLYPIKKLQPICKKEGLKPSYMPKACYVDGKMNSYANCKCEDEKGNCKICYPTIEKDTKNATVIYSPNWS